MRTPTHAITHSIGDVTSKARTSEGGQGLELAVVATNDAGTRSALAAARDLSVGLAPRIVLLVPHVVPYAQPLDHPANSVAFTENRFRKLAAEVGTNILVRVYVCRPEAANLETLLARDATVLVGGRSRRYWHTGEQRLAKRLGEHGRRVLFIDVNRRGRP